MISTATGPGFSFTHFVVSPHANFTAEPYSNIRLVSPEGGTATFTSGGGGGTNYASSSLDGLIADESGTWSLTTDYGLSDAHQYTFNVDLSAATGTPFQFLSPTSLPASFTDPVHLSWAGPVDNGPIQLGVQGYGTAGNTYAELYSLAAGTTSTDVLLNPGCSSYGFWLSQSRLMSFATVTTPMDSSGQSLPGLTIASQGSFLNQSALYLQNSATVPEPADYAAVLGACSFALILALRRPKAARC